MDQPSVYTGFWRNWPDGTLVITLTDQRAFVLISLLVFLVAFAGEAIWVIFCSLLRLHGTRKGWDRSPSWLRKIYELLAKEWSAFDSLFELFKRGYWPVRLRCWLVCTCLFILIALLAAGFPALAIVISYIVTAGTEENPQVIASDKAGAGGLWILDTNEPNPVARNTELNLNQTLAAQNYFDACYEDQYFASCNSNLNQQRLQWIVQHNVSCPFDPTVCREHDAVQDLFAPFRMETDFIDSHELGLNTRARFSIKKAVECAPIKTLPFCNNCNEGAAVLNFTFGDPSVDELYFDNDTNRVPGYRLTLFQQGVTDQYHFDGRLARTDGVTTLLWLSAPSINYLEPQDDPWFEAHVIRSYPFGQFYHPDYHTSLLGCVDQWKLCNNRTNLCSGWQAPGSLQINWSLFDFNNVEELEVGLILTWAMSRLSVYNIVQERKTNALSVEKFLNGLQQNRMARNQSQVEVNTWFGVSLAKLQLTILSIGIGDPTFDSTGFKNFLDLAENENFRNIPSLVKFKNGNYSIVAASGVFALVFVTVFLLVLSKIVERICREKIKRLIAQRPPSQLLLAPISAIQSSQASPHTQASSHTQASQQAVINPQPVVQQGTTPSGPSQSTLQSASGQQTILPNLAFQASASIINATSGHYTSYTTTTAIGSLDNWATGLYIWRINFSGRYLKSIYSRGLLFCTR